MARTRVPVVLERLRGRSEPGRNRDIDTIDALNLADFFRETEGQFSGRIQPRTSQVQERIDRLKQAVGSVPQVDQKHPAIEDVNRRINNELQAIDEAVQGIGLSGGRESTTPTASGEMVDVGNGQTLNPGAAAAFQRAQQELAQRGIQLSISEGFRHPKRQHHIRNVQGVRPAARAGRVEDGVPDGATVMDGYWSTSEHAKGNAFDWYGIAELSPQQQQLVRQVLHKHGFRQFDPQNDPGHFSYQVVG